MRRGLDLGIDGEPETTHVGDANEVGSVALLGSDAPGVRAELRVAPGDRVRRGQTLWVDRRRPEVRFTAPGSGVVTSLERGPRRRLEALVIRLEGDEAERFDRVEPAAVGRLPRDRLQALMLASGLWTALRTRPFGRIPDPGAAPRSLFVTALDSEPLAPPAERIIAERPRDFALGLEALTRLTDGPVYLCQRPRATLPGAELERVTPAGFSGPHPAGLAGTHIHFLDPVGPDTEVWHLGYADVLELGRVLAFGELGSSRVVALTGPGMARPRLVRTRPGADLTDLLRGELLREDCRVLSGSVLSGRQASGRIGFLGRSHAQVCALPEGPAAGFAGWTLPGRGGRARRVLGGLRRSGALDTGLGGRRGAFLPLERLERIMPLRLLPGPLLRALLVGDVDTAQQLGCLELIEEDLALAC
jgi:Na+-transporting NADH:ubiquinone oxidoreductase subunit A